MESAEQVAINSYVHMFFSCVFVFLPFETSGSASCRTIGFANCSILCCGNKCRVRPLVCMAFGHNEREWEDFRIFQPLIFSNFCLHLASFSLEHVGTDLAISTVFLLNLRQQLTLSLALLGCRSQCQINFCRHAIWLLRPLFFCEIQWNIGLGWPELFARFHSWFGQLCPMLHIDEHLVCIENPRILCNHLAHVCAT